MKSYTDLEQSKKLAEILPIESADMCYLKREINDTFIETPIIKPIGGVEKSLCCWSLTALLSVLPKNLNIGRPSLESNYKGYYWIKYYDEFMKPNNYKTKCFNNPVDACYEMIIKLNELKLL